MAFDRYIITDNIILTCVSHNLASHEARPSTKHDELS